MNAAAHAARGCGRGELALLVAGLIVSGCGGDGARPGPGVAGQAGADAGAAAAGGTGPGVGSGGTFGFTGGGSGPTPDAGGSAEPTCGVSPFGAARLPAHVLLVVDKSLSMTATPTGFTSDKWTATRSALGDALTAVQSDLDFGLGLFPFPDECEVPADGNVNVEVAAGSASVPDILGALDATAPSGGTPTAAALAQALEYFTSSAAAALEGRKYVLLATDGGPTCNAALSCGPEECVPNLEGRCPDGITNCCDPDQAGPGAERGCLDDAATLAQVSALATLDISTFVVGIPGSEIFADSLDAFALAGGVPNTAGPRSYFAVDDAAGLSDVLRSITRSLVTSCQLQLESVPPDLERLNVEVEGELIPRDGTDGWQLDTTTDPPSVIIMGETCQRIESQGVESVRVVYGCPTIRIQ